MLFGFCFILKGQRSLKMYVWDKFGLVYHEYQKYVTMNQP
jgi:hypothetical protein